MLLHLVGDDVVSVQAQTAVRAHVDIEVEDTCAVSPASHLLCVCARRFCTELCATTSSC